MGPKDNIPPALSIPDVSSSGAATLPLTNSIDPASSDATATAVVDDYSGVIITLTGASNAQTLGAPTDTTAGKTFTVVNNDTSTNTIAINGVTVGIGKAQSFIWDGTAWGPVDLGITSIPVPITQGGSGQATAQAAINALSAVSGATNEHVLTKDTATGDAVFKAIPAPAAVKLDDAAAPDDNTDLDATTSAHGLIVKATAPSAGIINVVGIANGETSYTNKPLFDTTDPSTQAYGDAAATGSAIISARRDHKHAMPAAGATLGANTFTGQQTFLETMDTVYGITDGAAFEIDPVNGNIQTITLGDNRTPAATNFAAGQAVLLGIADGTAYAITWTTVAPTWVVPGGTAAAPTLATTGYTWILLWKVSTTIYACEVGQP